MQSLTDMYRQVEKMQVQDIPWFYKNEYSGKILLKKIRPCKSALHWGWDTLTHA